MHTRSGHSTHEHGGPSLELLTCLLLGACWSTLAAGASRGLAATLWQYKLQRTHLLVQQQVLHRCLAAAQHPSLPGCGCIVMCSATHALHKLADAPWPDVMTHHCTHENADLDVVLLAYCCIHGLRELEHAEAVPSTTPSCKHLLKRTSIATLLMLPTSMCILPASQELADAHTAPSTAPSRKRLPPGTSDYQAAWITEAAGPDDLSSGSDGEDAALPQQQRHSMEEASEAGGSMEDDDEADDMLVSAACGGLWGVSS